MFYFDHVVFKVDETRFETACIVLSSAGFLEYAERVRKPDGSFNAFFLLSCTYIELNSIRAEEGASLPILVAKTDDIHRIHGILSKSVKGLQAVEIQSPSSGGPAWAIQRLPSSLELGCELMVIEYLRGIGRELTQRQGPNGIYALGGAVFVSTAPAKDCSRWMDLLSPVAVGILLTDTEITLADQRLLWHSPKEVPESTCGHSSFGCALFAVELLSSHIENTATSFVTAGFLMNDSNFGLLAEHSAIPGIRFLLKGKGHAQGFTENLAKLI